MSDEMATYTGRKVLVTGARGFIGRALVDLLLQQGADVTAFLRYDSRNVNEYLKLHGAPENLRVVRGDLEEPDAVREAVSRHEYVFHLGALVGIPYSYVHPREVFNTNLVGTMNVLMAVRESSGVKRLVLASTSEVFGSAQAIPMDENHPKCPHSPYAATKVGCDALGIGFHRAFGTPVVIVRPFNTFGPAQTARAVIPSIIVQALVKKTLNLGNTHTTRDFTFVTDTARGFLSAGLAGAEAVGEEINLGTGTETRISDIVEKVSRLTGVELFVREDPARVRPAKSEILRHCSNPTKAAALLHWRPEVDFDTGLARTVEWIRRNLEAYDAEEYAL